MADAVLVWIIIGGVSGWLFHKALHRHIFAMFGLLRDVLIGILGAVLGTVLASALWPGTLPVIGFNPGSILAAFCGAVALLLVVRELHRYRGRRFFRRHVRI